MREDDRLTAILRHWNTMDAAVAQVTPTSWGAVVTDPTSPEIWDVNYARVESDDPALRLAHIEAETGPALAAAGANRFHVAIMRPGGPIDLLTDLSSRGDRIRWELVMAIDVTARNTSEDVAITELDPDQVSFDHVLRATNAAFGVDDVDVGRRLRAIDRRMRSLGKRYFGVSDAIGPGGIAAVAALVPGDGVAYIDDVVTFPHARGRGLASRLVGSVLEEAAVSGASYVYLLADLHGPVQLYERLGFREVSRIASALSPVP
ncbi:MAG: GNAT family N-acetyltransferase [Actinomycetota bacterium]